jgi:hypothetical protein
VDVPQQTAQSILINSVLIIVACFVVGIGNVIASKRSCSALSPWNTSKMLRYIPLISFLPKLVLKLEFISSQSPLFFFVHLLQCHQQPTGSRLCGFYCAYHMLQLKDSGLSHGGTLLGSSFVKLATEHSSYLLALHIFGNHIYMCADWWHCYIQRLGLDEHPLEKSKLVNVCERIATFLVEQVITAGGKFHVDENVWAQIKYSD